MPAHRRAFGRAFLGSYRFARRVYAKTFSLGVAGAFHSFGRNSVLEPPIRLDGAPRIAIGDDVFVGASSWLQVVGDESAADPAVTIGDGTKIVGHVVLSAAERVVLGRAVLIARGVYVSDHIHAYVDRTRPVLEQGVDRVEPVEIGDGAWLGENVVICPGVTIGRGAVVGANAVVLESVPDYAVAVGVPARVVKQMAPRLEQSL